MNNNRRLKIFRKVFHEIHFTRLYDKDRLLKILELIDAWSFATNGSNGEMSQYEIGKQQDKILAMLEKI